MADTKITALTAISTVDPAIDVLPIVDVSDTTMAASGTTKKITSNQILGAGGTATLASATITGDLTVDTSTFKVDSTLDRVGVGITTIPFKFTVANAASVNTMCLVNTASNASRLVFGTNAVPGDSWTQIEGDARATGYFAIRTNDTERVRVDSSGNVGVGVTPSAINAGRGLEVGAVGNGLWCSNSTFNQILQNAYYNSGFKYAASASTAASRLEMGGGFNFYIAPAGTAGNAITFTQAMTLDASGNLTVANGNVILGTSGKGIDFSATASGSGTMTSELLNDYEEGTWVPVIADATTGGNTGTCTISSATYTKIGRQVSIQCDLRSIDTTGMTGANNLFIRGLPFASVRGGNGNFYSYRISRNASTVSSSTTVDSGVSHIYLSLYTTSSANTNLSVLVSDIVSGTSELALSVTYFV